VKGLLNCAAARNQAAPSEAKAANLSASSGSAVSPAIDNAYSRIRNGAI